jgi:hypothetical protein
MLVSEQTMKPAYDPARLKQRMQEQAKHLKRLLIDLPNHDAITDVFDYIVGAQYSLTKAIEIGFVDRVGTWHTTYRRNLPTYVESIAAQKPVNKRWLAGSYFNSGIQRLAACFDRVPKLLGASGGNAGERMKKVNGGSYVAWGRVYKEINAFKHAIEGRAAGRMVSMEDAVQAFEETLTLLTKNEAKLVQAYG